MVYLKSVCLLRVHACLYEQIPLLYGVSFFGSNVCTINNLQGPMGCSSAQLVLPPLISARLSRYG